MKENEHQNSARTVLTILLPVLCLLLLAALVLDTLHIVSLYRRTNGALLTYKTYCSAEQQLQEISDRLTEQARLFVHSCRTGYVESYFASGSVNEVHERIGAELTSAGDPCDIVGSLDPLSARAEALRQTEYHAMKLAALSYGLDISELPQNVKEYPLEGWEERLVSEQMRDEANALLYGEDYCGEVEALGRDRRKMFSAAEAFVEEQVLQLNSEIDSSLTVQRILLGVSAVALAGLILFLKRQRTLDSRTEQKRMAELEAAKSRAEAEDRTKTAFLLNISHDIRMPMNEIMGFTNLAQKHLDDPGQVAGLLEKIKSSNGRLLNIINDILELNRIENSALEITEVPADIMRSGEEIQTMLVSQAVSKGVDYALEIGDVTDRYVYVDIMHMVRVLVNLVSNAIKYTPEGGKVRLEIEQIGGAVNGRAVYRFTVRDTGIGMSAEFVQRLFDAYAREKNPAAGTRGAGLGLTITKKLVDRMGGTIEVKSEPGKGTVFTVMMPFRLQTKEEVEMHYGTGLADPAPLQRRSVLAGRRVLVADDNELAREITGEILRSEGAEADKTTDGADALRMFTEKPEHYYDLILLDTHMPIMGGFETAERIRWLDAGREIPIIALASAPQEEDKVNAHAAGMNAVLTKPLDITELMTVLRRF